MPGASVGEDEFLVNVKPSLSYANRAGVVASQPLLCRTLTLGTNVGEASWRSSGERRAGSHGEASRVWASDDTPAATPPALRVAGEPRPAVREGPGRGGDMDWRRLLTDGVGEDGMQVIWEAPREAAGKTRILASASSGSVRSRATGVAPAGGQGDEGPGDLAPAGAVAGGRVETEETVPVSVPAGPGDGS